MPGAKTNEREGTRAVLRHALVSPYKVRVVLDLIRGLDVARAREVLRFSERDAAQLVGKLLDSAVANAAHNDELDEDELFVSACFADEGRTLKRWSPRARGRATRIRKRTCHITVIVSRLPEDKLARLRARQEAAAASRRARRVAGGRRAEPVDETDDSGRRRRVRRSKEAAATDAPATDEPAVDADAIEDEGIVDQQAPAVEAADEATPEAVDESSADDSTDTTTAAVEDEGIVDQQAPAVEAADNATEEATEEATPDATEEEGK